MKCLGLDIGSSNIKGAVLDLELGEIGAPRAHPFPRRWTGWLSVRLRSRRLRSKRQFASCWKSFSPRRPMQRPSFAPVRWAGWCWSIGRAAHPRASDELPLLARPAHARAAPVRRIVSRRDSLPLEQPGIGRVGQRVANRFRVGAVVLARRKRPPSAACHAGHDCRFRPRATLPCSAAMGSDAGDRIARFIRRRLASRRDRKAGIERPRMACFGRSAAADRRSKDQRAAASLSCRAGRSAMRTARRGPVAR